MSLVVELRVWYLGIASQENIRADDQLRQQIVSDIEKNHLTLVQASFAMYNTGEEVELLYKAVAKAVSMLR